MLHLILEKLYNYISSSGVFMMGILNLNMNLLFMLAPWFVMTVMDLDGLAGWLLVLCAADISLAAGAHTNYKVI